MNYLTSTYSIIDRLKRDQEREKKKKQRLLQPKKIFAGYKSKKK